MMSGKIKVTNKTKICQLAHIKFGNTKNLSIFAHHLKIQVMGALARAVDFGNQFMKDHPEHRAEVRDYFQLMKDEIEEGSSTEHEIDLFIGACNDLLKPEES
jgi:hypothetical protein